MRDNDKTQFKANKEHKCEVKCNNNTSYMETLAACCSLCFNLESAGNDNAHFLKPTSNTELKTRIAPHIEYLLEKCRPLSTLSRTYALAPNIVETNAAIAPQHKEKKSEESIASIKPSLTSVTAFDNLDLLSLSHVRIYALKKRDQLR
ncbi:hypothetical protein KGM_212718 [Danaus plexippus plexippus]|uniref:Uncharacterized protein n=1 Tax=Danaus plexippus plexippus TaxID=278856 RepID=A0A212F240_DANPL|nr:hypothetical protein KGM_212718 [Danaus plexippus plexippus]